MTAGNINLFAAQLIPTTKTIATTTTTAATPTATTTTTSQSTDSKASSTSYSTYKSDPAATAALSGVVEETYTLSIASENRTNGYNQTP